ncbi:hypothetical protein DVS77_19280 [Mycolicibacterium moriokaense]|nr:hypothetical protein DVS77_19280 [Mycolicibacterium moriokaense]
MLEAHNGAVVASHVNSSRATPHSHAHMWWGILLVLIGVAAIAAIVVTAVMGLTTSALIIAIFTGAFFSRCAC